MTLMGRGKPVVARQCQRVKAALRETQQTNTVFCQFSVQKVLVVQNFVLYRPQKYRTYFL